jgi:hypothetical protein
LQAGLVRPAGNQHDRKIVPQLREVAKWSEQGRAEIALVRRLQATAEPPAGQMKCDVRLKFRAHDVIDRRFCRTDDGGPIEFSGNG